MPELFEAYIKRTPFDVRLHELTLKKSLPPSALRAAEGELLLKTLADGFALTVLDERGDNPTSESFAGWLTGWRDDGRPGVAFAIGGADGHDPALLQRADKKLSLGRLTWPHLLVRVMLAEQIYRASTIAQGHPYHRSG